MTEGTPRTDPTTSSDQNSLEEEWFNQEPRAQKERAEAKKETPEEPEEKDEPAGELTSIADGFKARVSRLWREHMLGQVVDETPRPATKTKVAKALGGGVIGGLLSSAGYKSLFDVPRAVGQFLSTSRERKRLGETVFQRPEQEAGMVKVKLDDGRILEGWEIVEQKEGSEFVTIRKDNEVYDVESWRLEIPTTRSPIEIKKQRIEEAIAESRYLTAEKKQELLIKLHETIKMFEGTTADEEIWYRKEVNRLLEEAIKARVTMTTALKETLNTLLVSSGLMMWRGGMYGAVSLYERHVKVGQEMEKGERREGYFKEMVVNGFKETWDKLGFKKGETKLQRAMNAGQALGTVIRFAGIGGLAAAELFKGEALTEAASQEQIEETLKEFEKHAAPEPAEGEVGTVPVATETVPQAAAESPASTEAPLEAKTTPEPKPEPAPVAKPTPAAEGETSEYISQDELERGTVRKGDGVIRIVQRQLKENPEKYGYTGDLEDKKAIAKWVRKTAFTAAQKAGIVDEGGWLGIRGRAIDKLSVGVTNENGELNFNFYNAQTGQPMSLEDAREAGYVHDYKKPTYEELSQAPETENAKWEKAWDEVPERPSAPAEDSHAEIETPPEVEPTAPVEDTSPETGTMPPEVGVEAMEEEHEGEGHEEKKHETEESEEPGKTHPTAEGHAHEEAPTEYKSGDGKVWKFMKNGEKMIPETSDYALTDSDKNRALRAFLDESPTRARFRINAAAIQQVPATETWRANAPAEEFRNNLALLHEMQDALKNPGELAGTSSFTALEDAAKELKRQVRAGFKTLGLTEKLPGFEKATSNITIEPLVKE